MSKVPDDFAREPLTWRVALGVAVPMPTLPPPVLIDRSAHAPSAAVWPPIVATLLSVPRMTPRVVFPM